MKVLILSTGTGEGHNSAAKAVKEQFDKNGVPCVMADALSFASEKAAGCGREIYIWSTVKAGRVFAGAYKAGRAITSAKRKSPVYYANAIYAEKLYRYIADNGFDAIVMPHLFPAEAVTYMRRKHPLEADTYFIATDYTCIPFTEETEPDFFIIPHEELTEEFAARGIPREKIVPLGIPVSERFVEPPSREACRKELGIAPEKQCILMMTGSMGYGHVESMAEKLVERTDEATLLCVMGGTNEKLKAALRERYAGVERVRILDFTEEGQKYMAAADVLFTKPGGLTSTEAVAAGIPLVHTSPIPGCEDRNAAFFAARGMAVSDKQEDALVEKGLALLRDKERCAQMRACQRKYGKPDAARRIYEFIVEKNVQRRKE